MDPNPKPSTNAEKPQIPLDDFWARFNPLNVCIIATSIRFVFLILLFGLLACRLIAAEAAPDPKTEQKWEAYEKADSKESSKP